MTDKSNGYEALAQEFMVRRSRTIGATSVREWSRALPRGASVLELGCGSGVPISQVLADEGFELYAVDASATLLEAYRQRFPEARVECAAAEESDFFDRAFDGIVAWGLMFLLPAESQRIVIGKAARALAPGGKLLFTAGPWADEWPDVMTRRMSVSLGADAYRAILRSHGLSVEAELDDEGENHYYLATRISARGSSFAHRSTAFMTNAPGGDMATKDTTAGGDNGDSAIEQSAQAVGSLIETGATVMGRGLAAGVEGMAQLAERAAQMTGLTSPRAIGNAAESATRATMTAARSVARTTRSVARSSATAASRTAGSATRAAKRAAKPMAKSTKKRSAKPAAKRSAKRSARPAMKASAQKGRRKVSQSTSMQSKRTGAKSGRKRKRS